MTQVCGGVGAGPRWSGFAAGLWRGPGDLDLWWVHRELGVCSDIPALEEAVDCQC